MAHPTLSQTCLAASTVLHAMPGIQGEGVANAGAAASALTCPLTGGASQVFICFSAAQATPIKINCAFTGAATATTAPAVATWTNGQVVPAPAGALICLAADNNAKIASINVWCVTAATVYVSWVP